MGTADRHAEIAGGGIAGLSAAIFLARTGWTVQVHEQYPEIGEIGAGLLLKPNSMKVLRDAGVLDLLRHDPATVVASSIRNAAGQITGEYGHGGRLTMICPLRQEVIEALRLRAEQLGVAIRTNSEIVGARRDGTLLAADGTEYPATLAIGADGWRSKVRDSLGLADTVRQLTHGATRLVIPGAPGDSPDTYREFVSGHRRVGLTPIRPDQLYIFLSCPTADTRGCAVPVDTESWAQTFPGLDDNVLQRIAESSPVRHAYNYVRVKSWSAGRVAIVGDAVNALPPTLAQGAGLAIMNGGGLAEELSRTADIPAALARWQQRYEPITVRTQRWSMRYLKLSNAWLSTRRSVQPYVLAASRLPLVNKRMRIADRVVVSGEGPREIQAA